MVELLGELPAAAIDRAVVRIGEVPAVQVVDVAVAVVILAVGQLALVLPDVRREVRVSVIHPAVEQRNDDRLGGPDVPPCLDRVDAPGTAPLVARGEEIPLLCQQRTIWRGQPCRMVARESQPQGNGQQSSLSRRQYAFHVAHDTRPGG